MVLSKTATYAIRAALLLAAAPGDEWVRVDDIARELDVPRNYLSKILHELARTGELESTRGPKGGFRLAVPATELSLERLVSRFDDVPAETACLLGLDECSDEHACAAHDRWKAVRKTLMEFLAETTLSDLRRRTP